MSTGQSDPEAVRRADAVYAVAASVSGSTAIGSQLLALASSARLARSTRITHMNQAIPAFIWFMLIFLYVVIMVFVILAATGKRGHLLLVATFTASTMIVLTLISLLDFPFQGALALPATAFLQLLR